MLQYWIGKSLFVFSNKSPNFFDTITCLENVKIVAIMDPLIIIDLWIVKVEMAAIWLQEQNNAGSRGFTADGITVQPKNDSVPTNFKVVKMNGFLSHTPEF